MYSEMHETWKRELENAELEKLATDFYVNAAEYLKCLREEGRMIDKRTLKARLLRNELQKTRWMLRGLVRTRYRKLARKLADGEKVPSELLTPEEDRIFGGCASVVEAYQSLVSSLLRGRMPVIDDKKECKIAVLRFLKDVPQIIGTDLKTYGSFRVEDIASLPLGNASILVKQGLAERVEVN
jgi:DNA replication initiation complex subunit (GINS family)